MPNEAAHDQNTCARIQDQIAAYREGWLEPQAAHTVEEHLLLCPACSAHLRLDSALVQAIEELPPVQAPQAEWTAVAAQRGVPLRTRDPKPVPALAWAGAAAILAVVALMVPQILNYRPSRNPAGVSPPITAPFVRVADTVRDNALAAHALASASSAGEDPNRAILLGYAAMEER
ncbi:MAG: anti-sigma factor family protein [Chthonomonadales bacterium]